jgi:hypothetical protein
MSLTPAQGHLHGAGGGAGDAGLVPCAECGHGFALLDEQLAVAGTPLSPGLREMIARAGAEVPFGKAAALIKDLAGVAVSAKTAERSAEASGAAARAAGSAEAAALRARAIRPLPPPEPSRPGARRARCRC